MKKEILYIALLVISLSLSAQENKVNKALDEIKSQLTAKKSVNVSDEILYNPGNEMFVLTRVKPWLNDTISDVRFKAIDISFLVGFRTQQDAFRQEAVRLLVQACRDKDVSLAGSAIDYLKHFNRRDFTRDATDSVRTLLKMQSPHLEKVIRLAGFLDLKDQQPYLENLLNNGQAATSLQWNIHLAMARMGNENSAAEIMKLIKDYPVGDDVMYHILPDLVYTRQKPVFDYLIEILNSDKRNCSSPNPYYATKVLCGYRVMEKLPAVIRDFPLKTTKSGQVDAKDYEAALQTARKWFIDHKEYEFNRDVY